jgi:hypothetical protein
VQLRVAAGVLSAGHARAILGLPTPEAQEAMAERAVAEGLSVRGVEEAVHLAHDRTGDSDDAAPARAASGPCRPGWSRSATGLSDRLETRVKLDLGKSRGKMTIEFATLEDLERIVALMESGPRPGRRPARERPQHDGAQQHDGDVDNADGGGAIDAAATRSTSTTAEPESRALLAPSEPRPGPQRRRRPAPGRRRRRVRRLVDAPLRGVRWRR